MPQNASHISRKGLFLGSIVLLWMMGIMMVGCKTQKEAVKTEPTLATHIYDEVPTIFFKRIIE